jgi:RHS repeat-associated protein
MPQLKIADQNTCTWQRTTLLAADNSLSIIGAIVDGKHNPIAYSAYGEQSAQQEDKARLGFNGQIREARIGWYLLGNGYRAYNPRLMRFHSTDSWSPFGGGGLNAYMYCVGDPVNRSDPTGHIGGLKSLFTSIKEGGFGLGKSRPVPLENLDLSGALNMLKSARIQSLDNVKPSPSPSFLSELGTHLYSLPPWRLRANTASLPEQSGHSVGGKWPVAMAAPQPSARGIDNPNLRSPRNTPDSIEASLFSNGDKWTSNGGVHGRSIEFARIKGGGGTGSSGRDLRSHTSPGDSTPVFTQYRIAGNNPTGGGWVEDTSSTGHRNIQIRSHHQRYPTVNNPNASDIRRHPR